ncbi:hypothetical protein BH09MYX1_BH09MYX1_50200 [soil metagenome]
MPPPSKHQERKLGLPAVHELREKRKRGSFNQPTGTVWLVVGGGLVASLLIYRFVAGGELERRRDALLSKQRATEVTLGADWTPLRDRIETYVVAQSGAYAGDNVSPDVKSWDFRGQPGIYLRLRVDDATSSESIRKNAEMSFRDGFTGCFLRGQNEALARGDADAGVFIDQPWNLRQAYTSTRVLTPAWVSEVKESSELLRLHVFEQQYDKAEAEEIPRAISIVQKAQFLLVVLDEHADEAPEVQFDAGDLTNQDTLQLAPHWARVSVLDLRNKTSETPVFRLRRYASGTFYFAGEKQVNDPETLDAMKRQVNNCALANAVTSDLGLK